MAVVFVIKRQPGRGSIALRRLEQGRLAASHILRNVCKTSGQLYFEGLPRFLGLGLVKRLKV